MLWLPEVLHMRATNTLPGVVIQSAFPLLLLDRYLLPLTTVITNPEIVMKFFLPLHAWECIYCQIWSVSSSHTTFGFCLNSLNSVKVI